MSCENTKEYKLSKFLALIEAGKENEALEYKNSRVPEFIYKYYSFSNKDKKLHNSKMDTLRDNKIFFAPIKTYNDPFEFKVEYIDRKQFGKDIISADGVKHNPDYIAAKIRFAMNYSQVRFSSFSVKDSDFPMWAYYADSFSGFCVKYKVNEPDQLFKVFYRKEKKASSALDILLGSDQWKKDSLKIAQLFSIKYTKWKHEKEYRLVLLQEQPDAKDGVLETCENLGIEPVEIILGCNSRRKNLKELKSIVADLNKNPKLNVCLKKMILKSNDYGFYTRKISI